MTPEAEADATLAETIDLGPCNVCGRRNPADARFCGGCGNQLLVDDGAVKQQDMADPLVGRVIADRYRIVALLGRGGMGVVYKVEHIHIGKLMAMKLLHGELARDRNTVKRFQREAEAASRLSHPNTVAVFDFGRSEGLMYLVMEYLEGKDLGQVVRDAGHLDFPRAARIAAQVCASVAEAHAQGIVHRDIKPENVMILRASGGETAKVLDFGLAKLRDQTGSITVTRAGHIVGTPYYMPPEQIRGEEVDARGDVYAIGAMLYKAATGVPPFVANTPMGVLTKHLTEPLELPSARSGFHMPPEADAIIGRAMAKDRGDRFQSAEEMREELVAYLDRVGEGVTDPALRSSSSASRTRLPAGGAIATRKEVERYEKRLRRRGLLAYVFLALLLAVAGVGGWFLWQRFAAVEAIPTAEHEPNDVPENANPLPAEVEITAYLGKRHDERFSDIDLFRIDNQSGERQLVRFDVSAPPNIDVVVDVVRVGHSSPVLTADSAGVGGAESVPNFPLQPDAYFLRVHERWISGEWPTENVSDPYTIRWSLGAPQPGWEEEVNDSLELAQDLAIGEPVRGYVGWGGDVDIYCGEGSGDVIASLQGVPEVDLVLRVVDRVRLSSTKVDAGAIGEGETSASVPLATSCFEVGAGDAREGARRSNPDAHYELVLRGSE